ncbi:MFS transporter [Amycolatopsis sp. NBC_01480]|uniref:MFS transporter n=1 Tax=Amycolatopsis sp. NBC_01480 TaxID=2903562 RepID=UPI002E27F34B|nr:MFS transporter [Amycolatopsis sp. NBC_01480]
MRVHRKPHHKPHPSPDRPRNLPAKLPTRALLPLATAVFLTSLTETLPAGVLPGLSAGLGVSEAAAGQAVTVYALGTALTAIPLSAVTSSWGRKRLLLTAMAGFAAANTVTAVSGSYPLTMAARFIAGVAAGLAWALLAGFARGLAPEPLRGKAIALVMTGIPVALSFGVPAGTFAGDAFGWRAPFFAMTGLAVGTLAWIAALVPEQPGRRHEKAPALKALAVPGVTPVLAVTLVFVLAHTILYTYVATFLTTLGLSGQTDLVLLVFGLASLVSIAVVGAHIQRRLRALTLAGTVLVAVAAAALAGGSPVLVYVAAALWGLGWGGVPTLLQTAAADAGGEQADAAQAMLVTLWNAAMAGGGVAGGILLDAFGARVFPWSALILLGPVLVVVVSARSHGFPRPRAAPAA